MKGTTARLSRTITWAGSRQAFLTIRLLVDKALVDDAYRAYAYFRWVDDFIDSPIRSDSERTSFIQRQRDLVEHLYVDEQPPVLCREEEIDVDLINNDSGTNNGLQSYIRTMMDVMEFDASRKGRLISEQELTWYSDHLGKAVVDCIQYFIGNEYSYPHEPDQYKTAVAAHIVHMLRDMQQDISNGFFNIPGEFLQANGIQSGDVENQFLRDWVHDRVTQSRGLFKEGKAYLETTGVLRYRVAGHWYAARFEVVLDAIERDEYVLRSSYNKHLQPLGWLKLPATGIMPALRHIVRSNRP